ncbi:MAG TPA: ABC transporter permease [Actinomycetota bacterium]|nr:ABC transporter permease [Actinomycetota bacterium]
MSAVATSARSTTRILRRPDVRLGAAWRLWQRNAAIYKRTYKLNLIPNFFEPVFLLLAMGLGLGAYLSTIQGVRYVDFIAPGLLATSAMFGTSFEVTFNAFVKLHFGKIYDAVMSTPLTPEDIALGELLWGTTRSFIYGMVFLAIVSFFGVLHTPLVALAPVATILVGMMFSVIGLTFTAVIPHIDYYTYYWTMFLTPMFLFSGIFFPLDRLPEWFQTAAWFVPLYQAVRLMRALMLTGDVGEALAAGLWIAVVTAVLVVLPLNLLRRRLVH